MKGGKKMNETYEHKGVKWYVMNYKGSAGYNSVMGAFQEQLLYRLPYTKNAIEFHKNDGNTIQVKFFSDELMLINKRLKLAK